MTFKDIYNFTKPSQNLLHFKKLYITEKSVILVYLQYSTCLLFKIIYKCILNIKHEQKVSDCVSLDILRHIHKFHKKKKKKHLDATSTRKR